MKSVGFFSHRGESLATVDVRRKLGWPGQRSASGGEQSQLIAEEAWRLCTKGVDDWGISVPFGEGGERDELEL